MMKYFHPSLCRWEEQTAPDDSAERYARHLEAMEGVLPPYLLKLARLPGVDDALVVSVRHDRAARRFTLVLRAGDLQIGYYDLLLEYEDAEISPADEWRLACVVRADYDVAFHEVDRAEDGAIEHRLLFHPGIWFAIRCRRLRWERRNRPNRARPRSRDRFPDAPMSPPEGFTPRCAEEYPGGA